MDNKALHIIHKIYCEVLEASPERSQMLKDNLAEWLTSELLPLLEIYLEQMDRTMENVHYQIPKLEISLHSSSKVYEGSKASMSQLAKDQLLSQVREQLEQQFQQLEKKVRQANFLSKERQTKSSLSGNHTLGLSNLEREIKSTIQILETGEKPWWLSDQEELKFFSNWSDVNSVKSILIHPNFLSFLEKSGSDVNLRNRFLKQFSYNQIKSILSVYSSEKLSLNSGQKLLSDWPNQITSQGKSIVLEDIWRLLLSKREETEIQSAFFNHIKKLESTSLAEQENLLKIYQTSYDLAIEQYNYQQIAQSNWYSALSKYRGKANSFLNAILPEIKDAKTNELESIALEKNALNLTKESKAPSLIHKKDHLLDDHFFDKELHLDQAGLILLHPFFKELFNNCKLLNDKNEFTDIDRAVHLLHYLATKEEMAFDHEMIFEKYCCGLPMDHIVNREIILSDEMKEHADELLKIVIGHWTALKGTGLDTLRAEFLYRKGKLDTRGKYPKLIIERKTQDILMEKLPWSIGMAKFPWKKGILFIEW
ncbi:contractile injection system tape measure protein [Echinicola shivajiensis]|uniref:contractile injection system tape measure protein n=1 Tax=Echinicola shivajiensis TaxID=1035916 RepID=UPI001BFCAC66|nr:contractile injection system tape measure protein [Echinicola shivajiensis]